ncbi:hypothetical protein LH433_13815 [Laribacter hongkongensis]|uniref:hypothetical protein n=1 Tax=Laribacter hongkongensis TaxID=168471 RepID=UPI001EFDF803|nr:hypothetical protein [Laribacter hongkongensis]MCG9107788.1 hypothetical protein [Laribacter hongkongensis]
MPEPISGLSALGFKAPYLLAGFAGGVISLSYARSLSKPQMAAAVFGGAMASNYLTPMAVHYASIPADFAIGTGFVLGLCALSGFAGLIRLAERWASNPGLPGKGV